MKRYYYKNKNNKEWYNLKTPDFDGNEDFVKISETEFNNHSESLRNHNKGE